ncbi:hypothetical protein CAEBREN_18570 [Caenorhabditis brenneri]|uniref:TIL domain-containing protein n=1 Tax=Caenorhabditis brenneri TaxID=135651 RepID=G0N4I8_CAEBE|nr:hypothetical protein CAEBREN_18570 [Caenorhabditis brenneri]
MKAIAFFILLAVMLQLGEAGSAYCETVGKTECDMRCQRFCGLELGCMRKCEKMWCDCSEKFVGDQNNDCNKLQDCPKKSNTTPPTQKNG